MRPVDLLWKMSAITEPTKVTLSPGPWSVIVGPEDAKAANILLSIYDGLTVGQVEHELLTNMLRFADREKLLDILAADPEYWDEYDWLTPDASAYLTAWRWTVFWAAQKQVADMEKEQTAT